MLALLVASGTAAAACPAAHDCKCRTAASTSACAAFLRSMRQVAWASGQKGTVLRTVDGGAHWQAMHVEGAEALDFRDIEGFTDDVALALSIGPGDASRIYRTEDGGASWTLALQNNDPRGFFDCMAFEGQHGWLLGDPVDGRYQVFATTNGGRDWHAIEGPAAAKDEAAFAASGTCIARLRGALAVASGGAMARIHLLRDGQRDWHALDAGMARRKPEAGVFSVVPSGTGWFAVGGDYRGESRPGNATLGTRATSSADHRATRLSLRCRLRRATRCPASRPGHPAPTCGMASAGIRWATSVSMPSTCTAMSDGSVAMAGASPASSSTDHSFVLFVPASISSVGRNFGGLRALVACSKP